MKKIVLFLLASICFSGCVQKCNPTYVSDSSVFERFERVKGLPIKVNAEDNRTPDKKFFLKLGFVTGYEKDGKNFNEYQLLQLEKPSKEIIQTAFAEGLKRCGFTLNDDASIVANISVEKFVCTVSGGKSNEALIELDLSIRDEDKTIYHKHISELYTQKFNAFRQLEDAEPLLSKCLTMAVEKALTNAEFSNQITANIQFFQTKVDKKAALLASKKEEEAQKAAMLSKKQQEEETIKASHHAELPKKSEKTQISEHNETATTALVDATMFNTDPEATKALIKAGADIEAKDKGGATVLMTAAAVNPNPEVIRVLIEAGADINAKDNNGRKAADYAKLNISIKRAELLSLLGSNTVSFLDVVKNNAWDGSVYQVTSWLKANLKDPRSFEVIEWGAVTRNNDGNFQVACRYRAKNSFGGYVISCQLFTLDSEGNIIKVEEGDIINVRDVR